MILRLNIPKVKRRNDEKRYKEISAFEIEDKVFEERILNFCKDIKLNYITHHSFLPKGMNLKVSPNS